MPTVKEHVRNLLDDLPDNISWKQLRHEIWVMEQIELADAQIDRGETMPHEQVMEAIDAWLLALGARKTRKRPSNGISREANSKSRRAKRVNAK